MNLLSLTLANLAASDLATAARALFASLGYASDKIETLPSPDAAGFAQAFGHQFSHSALQGEWKRLDLLFQITSDEIGGQLSLQSDGFNPQRFDSFLFFAVELEQESYSRGQLAGIARELNKPFPAPVIVLFRHGRTVSLASLHRRENKRDANRDVLDRVVLLKDIRLENTHRAHFDILLELGAARTRARDWNHFLGEWNRVLDLSELNKKFFRELSNWYFWACQNVEFPRPKTDARSEEEHRAMSVIRLITRLMFVWFIKERDLVPDEFFQKTAVEKLLHSLEPDESNYYKAVLQNLFFATLNTDGKRHWRENKDSGFGDKSYNTHTLWRYKTLFQNPDDAAQMFNRVPFLNGGLFRCLDNDVTKDGGKKIVERFDGFSEREDNPLRVPNFLFWGEAQNADLNAAYGTKGREYKVRPLISILQSYVFTVAENTPLEEEVALDPELLGKVFENLLASYNPETSSTARKQTGSFYTPRPIVEYLVEESLFAHLETRAPSVAKADLRVLLSPDAEQNPDLSEAQRLELIAAIHGAKILDPACGSGAFVMGALESLVRLLKKVDKGNTRWKAQELRAINAIGMGEARDAARARFDTAFARDSGDYARKLYLLERCIHGVDIQPIAVQIAKLRVFISLAIEQKIDRHNPDNFGIESLPNLETKIVAANTLRSLEKPIDRDLFTDDIQSQLRDKSLEYFTCFRRARKLELETQTEALLEELSDHILQTQPKAKTDAALLRNWRFWDQNSSAPFFDREWMFGAALQDGFDIVIGNPPYLRVQGIAEKDAAYYRKQFQSAKGAFDLYALFIERGFGLLSESGTLGFIVPHKFFQAAFGESLRLQLTTARALRQIVRFGHAQVFEEATTYTCLLFLSKAGREKFDLLEIERLDHASELFKAVREGEKHPQLARAEFPAPVDTGWDFSLSEAAKVKERLEQHPHTLGEAVRKIFQGIPTGADKIFVLQVLEDNGDTLTCFSKALEKNVVVEKAITRPFLMGKDVHRYEPPHPRNVVLFPHDVSKPRTPPFSYAEMERRFPKAWAYFKENKEALLARENQRFKDSWHQFSRPQNLNEFEAPKIMTPEIALGCQMSLDSQGICYHTTKVYSFVFNGTYPASEKFLLGLLNAKVLWFYLTQTGYLLRGGFYTFKTDYLKPFPLPIAPDAPFQELVERLVDYQLHLKSGLVSSSLSVLMATGFSRLLDALIYELYFPEAFETRARLSQVLSPENLPPLPLSDAELETVFKTHFAPTADARAVLFALEEIEAVRVIEAASPGRGKSGGED